MNKLNQITFNFYHRFKVHDLIKLNTIVIVTLNSYLEVKELKQSLFTWKKWCVEVEPCGFVIIIIIIIINLIIVYLEEMVCRAVMTMSGISTMRKTAMTMMSIMVVELASRCLLFSFLHGLLQKIGFFYNMHKSNFKQRKVGQSNESNLKKS